MCPIREGFRGPGPGEVYKKYKRNVPSHSISPLQVEPPVTDYSKETSTIKQNDR